jgi:hypothetical protein
VSPGSFLGAPHQVVAPPPARSWLYRGAFSQKCRGYLLHALGFGPQPAAAAWFSSEGTAPPILSPCFIPQPRRYPYPASSSPRAESLRHRAVLVSSHICRRPELGSVELRARVCTPPLAAFFLSTRARRRCWAGFLRVPRSRLSCSAKARTSISSH